MTQPDENAGGADRGDENEHVNPDLHGTAVT